MTWKCAACGRLNIWWKSTCKDCGAKPGDPPLEGGTCTGRMSCSEPNLSNTMQTYGVGWPD